MTTPFPDSRVAAISFTYDDGLDVHLDHAMPDLETAGLRGSFYIPTRQYPDAAWNRRPDDWRSAVARGHEIGNHTQYHPCGGHHNWIKRGFALDDYDMPRMEAELRGANDDLRAVLGPAAGQTFAYTCCESWVSPQRESYCPLAGRLFLAARGGGNQPVSADPADVDLSLVPSWALVPTDAARTILDHIDATIDRRHWTVLQFHGVGGGHRLDVARDVHQAICAHVAGRADSLWCATMVDVATHLRRTGGRGSVI